MLSGCSLAQSKKTIKKKVVTANIVIIIFSENNGKIIRDQF